MEQNFWSIKNIIEYANVVVTEANFIFRIRCTEYHSTIYALITILLEIFTTIFSTFTNVKNQNIQKCNFIKIINHF